MTAPTRVPCSYPECGGGCAGCQPEPQQTPRPSWVDGGATLHRTEGALVIERVPADRFENAIRTFGVVAACEWFGHAPDSEFTQETVRILAERAAAAPNQGEAS